MLNNNPHLQNPHLEGDGFFWENGPAGVLLVHGFTATTAEVRPLAKVLYEHGFTVAGPLLPGHGTDPEEANRCRWQDWYAAVEESYQQLRKSRSLVFVGGQSMGSLLTLLLAAKNPEISGILSFSPAIELASRMAALLGPLVAPFKAYQPKPVRGPTQSDDLWQGYRVHPVRGALQLLHLQKVVRMNLPAIHQPALIVQGRLDPTISTRAGKIVFEGISSQEKELVWLENSAHCVTLDAEKEAVSKQALQFLERIAFPDR